MAIEIKELVSNSSVLVDLTDAESSKVNGGYAGIVVRNTGSLNKGASVIPIVFGKRAEDPSAINPQFLLGIPRATVVEGILLAQDLGRGFYTPQVTAATLVSTPIVPSKSCPVPTKLCPRRRDSS